MESIKGFFGKYAKALLAWLLAVVGNMVWDIIEGRVPFPTSMGELGRYALTSVLAALGAYLPRNKQSLPQVETAIQRDLSVRETKAVAVDAAAGLPADDRVRVIDDVFDTLPTAVRDNVLHYRGRSS